MGDKRDYYEVLGISRQAGQNEIKKAYRKLAMEFHPDRNPGDHVAEEKFKEAAEAYEILSDSQKKERYDRFGHQGISGRGSDFGGFDFDLSDALRTFMSGFGGFGDIFGNGSGKAGPPRGSDLQVKLSLTLQEVAAGYEKTINIKKYVHCDSCGGSGARTANSIKTCPQCQGTGQVKQISRSILGQFVNITPCRMCSGEGKIVSDPCKSCQGTGRVRGEHKLKVKIPAGVSTGNYLTFQGEGDVGPSGGAAGNVIVFIEEKDDSQFERHGDDILFHLNIGIPQAVLGDEIDIPTLNGKVKLQIDPGTQSGKILRMRSKGIPHLHGSGRGDQLVQVNIWTPEKISKETKKLFEQLATHKEIFPKAG